MNVEEYLKIIQWARDRYMEDGELVLERGGEASAYSVIERLAWDRYMKEEGRMGDEEKKLLVVYLAVMDAFEKGREDKEGVIKYIQSKGFQEAMKVYMKLF